MTRPVPALPEAHVRPQLLRLAVLPPLAVALSASAAVLFTVRATGARPGLALWSVLAGAVSVTVAGIAIAAVAADRAARAVSDRLAALRRSTARGEADLRALVESLRRGDGAPQRKPRGGPPADADDFELLAADLARARDGAVHAVVQAAQLSSQAGSEQKLEVFVNLARRLQSLVHREISILDELENEIEDPDLLKGLFHVDHLATRIRRHAENLAVLGGAVSRRQWSNPVSMTEVLRSAIAEVEQYSRVKLVPPIDGELRGHAVADVIHLLAELVENATVFSAPQTQVLLRANLVTSGLAVEVDDRGLGLPLAEQQKMNALLADPDQVNVASLLADGRIGLFVVSQLARRHGINVRLQTNIYGGVQAVLVVPQALLGTAPGAPAGSRGTAPTAVPAGDRGRSPEGGRGAGAAGTWNGPGDTGTSGAAPGEAWSPPGESRTTEPAGRRAPPEPSTGRRRHAQRDSTGATGANGATESAGAAGATASAAGDGGVQAPLPVRGAHEERPNPAEAVPGIRSGDRWSVDRQAGMVPTPRGGTVRGTMDRPRLPRRRAQEHIAPQLRGGPAPRPGPETLGGHDPGLMAAFQRGIGLAEAQQEMESTPPHTEPPHMDAPHMGTAHIDAPHMGAAHPEGAPVPGSYLDGAHMDGASMEAPHTSRPHRDAAHTGVAHMDVPHTDAAPPDATRHNAAHTHVTHTHALPMDLAHRERAHTEAEHLAAAHTDGSHTDGPHTDAAHMNATHTDATHTDATHTDAANAEAVYVEGGYMGAAPHTDTAATPEPHARAFHSDPSVRPDGSAPTG
ncbi:ATP-binding protein [Streptomyces shenzhenensis]|uniref:ATP-binding protein n=1 Tax=Streptomyces shenzhenensis TaxID=943815 RepID=UPI003803BCF9